MFETYDAGKLSLFSGQGKHLWSYVVARLQNPWFHLNYSITDDCGEIFFKTLFLSDVNQLLELSRRASVKLEFVDIVSPEYMNGTNRWKMEPLWQIWRRESDNQLKAGGYVFVLESGVKYQYPQNSSEGAGKNDQLIFQLMEHA